MLAAMSEAHRRTDTDSIGLAGDGDDVDLIRAIEGSFQVQFGNDTVKWFTVGDIYDALLRRMPMSSTAGLCATSMAFYRIRAALARTAEVRGRAAPTTKLAGLTPLPPKRRPFVARSEMGREHAFASFLQADPVNLGLGWEPAISDRCSQL
jgi:hypothetical protein